MGSLLQQIAERVSPFLRYHLLVPVATLSAAIVAGGCGSESAVTTVPTQVKCQVALAASSSSIGPDGGTGTVTVTTAPECPWDVSTGANWLSGLSPTSGQGTSTVEFRVAPNPLPSIREGEIVVNDNRVRVSQEAAPCRFELRPASLTVDAKGETREVAVSTVSACSWTIATDVNWISFTTRVTGSGAATVRVSIAPNPDDEQRIGTLTLEGQRSTVIQTGVAGTPGACTYQVNPSSATMAATGGAGTVTVSAGGGCTWTANSSAGWITVTSGAGGSGDGTVTFSVAANTGGVRSGTLTIAGQTFTVTQGAALVSCTYSISPTTSAIAASGGTGTVAVSAGSGCAWTAGSSAGWVTVSSGASGSGNGSVTFSVAANTGGARSGTLTVAGQTFSVTQGAALVSCTYSISPTTSAIAASGGTGTVAVSAGSGCAWTASSGAGWVTVSSGASGSGNGSVTFSVAANTGGARSGSVTIAGQTLTVTQAAASVSCTYSISPTSVSISGAGTGTVAVSTASGCAWTASSQDNWITVTSSASGTGSGAVAYSAAAPPGKNDRTGKVTIAGHTFTVMQTNKD
jgi:hypothetical protein